MDYFKPKREIYEKVLNYIDNESVGGSITDETFSKYFDINKIIENQEMLFFFVHLISYISNNHHRKINFNTKIEQILFKIKDNLKSSFLNTNIFELFKDNKHVLLFLIQNDIISLDHSIITIILEKSDKYYQYFFYPEIKNIVDSEKSYQIKKELLVINPQIFDSFDEKRKKGENESYICELIREDSLEKFKQYCEQESILPYKVTIKPSIFETNNFLTGKAPLLIEYAAFFGSFQIFQYLYKDSFFVDSTIWLYSVHSQNIKLVQFLFDSKNSFGNFSNYLEESIKCHHNEIASFIQNNFIKNESRHCHDENIVFYSFKYCNFAFFGDDYSNLIDYNLVLIYACQNNLIDLVEFLLNYKNVNINFKAISNYFLMMIKFYIYINETPIHLAAKNNFTEIINLLLNKEEIEIDKDSFYECEHLTKIEIPSFLTKIGEGAFRGCTSLSEILFSSPSSLKFIGKRAFSKCSSLIDVRIPSSVIVIEENAFENCSSLIRLQFENPSLMKSININIFDRCKSLEEITIVPSFETVNFIPNNFPKLTKIIFSASLNEIKKDFLSKFKHIKQFEFETPSLIVKIGQGCFYSCESMEQIEIPSSIIQIESAAFYGCSSLRSIKFSNNSSLKILGDNCFSACKLLKEIRIPPSVTTIGNKVFMNCSSLEQIIIPTSVTSIGEFSFSNTSLKKIMFESPSSIKSFGKNFLKDCSSLTEIDIPSSVSEIDPSAFENTLITNIKISSSLEKIASSTFKNLSTLKEVLFEQPSSLALIDSFSFTYCSSLVKISIPSSVVQIGEEAFAFCSSLVEIKIPSSVKIIGDYAFKNCTSLKQILFDQPSSIDKIGNYAFLNCESLKKAVFPPSFDSFDFSIFNNCNLIEEISFSANEIGNIYVFFPNLKKVIIPPSIKAIPRFAFTNCTFLDEIIFYKDAQTQKICKSCFENCTSLKEIEIPSPIRIIGSNAFKDCSNLVTITFPSSIAIIKYFAFINCTSLQQVVFNQPSIIKTIHNDTFNGCSSLTSFDIPPSVVIIDDAAFRDCSSLKHVSIPPSVKYIGNLAFFNCSSLESIFIPSSVKKIKVLAFGKCTALEKVDFDNDSHIKEIDMGTFSKCSSLVEIAIPDSVTIINDKAFAENKALKKIKLSSSLTLIKKKCFSGCSSIVDLEIPPSVSEIGEMAFSGCSSLSNLLIPSSIDISEIGIDDTVNVTKI